MAIAEQQNRQNRSNNFDLLRLLFAGMVCVVHLYQLSGIAPLAFLEKWISTGVAVHGFFIVSGYLIFQSMHGTSSVRRFYEKRVRRLYPAYVTVILTSALGMYWISDASAQAYFSIDTLRYVGWNLTFLNFMEPTLPGVFMGHLNPTVNGALWTLKIEVLFYLIVPLIYACCQKFRAWVILTLIYIVSVVFVFTCAELARQSGNPLFQELTRQLPGQLSYFAVGMLWFRYSAFFQRYGLPLCIASILLLQLPMPDTAQTILNPFALGTLVIYAATQLRSLGNICRYGDVSYGMYILHFPIIQICIAVGLTGEGPWIFSLVALGATLVLSALMWGVVEKRFLLPSSHYRMKAREV